MATMMDAAGLPLSLRAALAQAEAAAARVLGAPELQAIEVIFDADRRATGLVIAFQSHERSWLGRRLVRVCSVTLPGTDGPPALSAVNDATALAATGRLPPGIPTGMLAVDLADVLAIVAQDDCTGRPERGSLQLTLTSYEGRPVWWAIDETSDGIRTLGIAGDDGTVVFEGLHVAHEPGLSTLDLGSGWERCRACDDVLVQVRRKGQPVQLAVVHLTWTDPGSAMASRQRPYFEYVSAEDFSRRFIGDGEHL
jgi:hypothetical protein